MADPFNYSQPHDLDPSQIERWLLLLIARALVENLPAGATKTAALAKLSDVASKVLPGG